jgi:exo-beta-1,3-glucanase (GH17 family)/cellulose synthase/poly-beta-1,6-N-acetylglucosamine synthase-like glycosyltransferase
MTTMSASAAASILARSPTIDRDGVPQLGLADAIAGTGRGRFHRFFHPGNIGAVLLSAAIALGVWSTVERPRAVPDYDGSVAGMAFSPYQRGEDGIHGAQPTDPEIRSDLTLVANQVERIRTYSVKGTLADIPRLAGDLPLKITLGGWIAPDLAADAAELNRLVAVANGNRNVDRVLVGNEVLLRGDMTADQLIAEIRSVKARVHVPVSTAEPWHVWLAHPELARSVDYITIHLLPYWEGLSVDDALRFTLQKLDAVQAAYPGKKIVIGEVGWPSNGVDVGAAHASRVNQARFMREFFRIAESRGLDYFVMEAFDQPWKTSFEGRAAGYWGMMDLDRAAKWDMTGPVVENPNWTGWAFGGALFAAVLSLLFLSRRPDIRTTGKLTFGLLMQGFAGTLACLLMAMAGTYLSAAAAAVWVTLSAFQLLLLVLLSADSFELAETIWGRSWKRRPTILPCYDDAKLPKVSLHLPICNEPPEMVAQTLNALAQLDYPEFEVLVIDNNTMDPKIWEPVAEQCARLGSRFRFFHLGKFPGYKAGALNFGLRQTAPDAKVIGVLDSDYIVSPDWLRCMVPNFARPEVGFVQSPQDYRDNDGGFFKRLMFWEYAGFFKLGMITRNERNAIIQHGTMTLVRRTALEGVNGWAEWTICEDAQLGLSLFRHGWEAVYSERSFGRGVMPDDFAAFRKQRFRWAYGAMQIVRGNLGALLNPFNKQLTLGQKYHFVTGWLPWVGDALGLAFLGLGLLWSALLIAFPYQVEFPVALFMLPSIGLFAFKIAQIFSLYAARVQCGWRDRAGAALAGLALSHGIGLAVWKGLIVKSAPFLRTPKMANAPALVQGLVMAREELALLVLSWAAMLGVAITHHLATLEARLWCAVLLTQSLPYLASVVVSVVAAMPAKVATPAVIAAQPVRQPVYAELELAAGD